MASRRVAPVVLALALISCAFAQAPSWKKVSVTGSYQPRGEAAFARCGPRLLCLLGGRGGGTVNVLNTETLTWTAASKPPVEMHHFQAAYGPDQCVWVAGAWTGPYPAEDNVDTLWRYCQGTDEWVKGATIPRPRGGGGSVIYGNKLYLVSGNVGGHNTDANVVAWFDSYDFTTREWEQLPDVPHPRDHFHATVVGDKLYVVGGRDSSAPNFFNAVTHEVNVYDFSTGTWSVLPDFSRPRGGSSTVTFANTVYVLGGESNGQAWTDVSALVGSSFQAKEDMADPRHGTGVVACSGAMWIAGGADKQGGGSNAKDTYAFFSGDTPPVCTGLIVRQTPVASPSASAAAPSPVVTPPPSSSSAPSAPTSSTPSESPTLTQETTSEPTSTSTSTSTPTANDDDISPDDTAEPSAGPACFPASATVELSDGSVRTMAELTVGDRVKVAHPAIYSDVFFFSHDHATARGAAIRLETGAPGAALTLSPGHLVYANGKLQPAHRVRVGDTVSVRGSPVAVTQVRRVVATGKHNPHTMHGDIIVDGVAASTYTTAMHPAVARALLLPFRMAYRAAGAHDVVRTANRAVLQVLSRFYWR